ncbi:MAG: CDP-alcohol phosphatidyltransferase family protein [Candidatus Aureabacteria bacterium]|nr:CDP-alcohol phosphatidyltransferase family protein [Candidatus Auribacterota bacterium]
MGEEKQTAFAGNQKTGEWFLAKIEKKFVQTYVSKVPRCLETYHLTLMTVLWSALILVFSYLAGKNLHWLWLVSFMIVMQYITDVFDGAVGRIRDTGLIKWGYYMDHFLDYVFMSSILIGWAFILPEHCRMSLFFIFALSGAFMVNAFLTFSVTNEFNIGYFNLGPTEMRIIFVIVNMLIIFFGTRFLELTLPYILAVLMTALIVTVYKAHKLVWKIDMDNKK